MSLPRVHSVERKAWSNGPKDGTYRRSCVRHIQENIVAKPPKVRETAARRSCRRGRLKEPLCIPGESASRPFWSISASSQSSTMV